MDPSLAAARIKKMKDIIHDEAHDKAKKIEGDAANQANIEKNKMINSNTDKIDTEFRDKMEKHKLKLRMYHSLYQSCILYFNLHHGQSSQN
jgi:hypothetical protein